MLVKNYIFIVALQIFFALFAIYFSFNYFFLEKNIKQQNFSTNAIVFVQDVSNSMLTKDVYNRYGISLSRLDLSKLFISRFTSFVNSGILIGLVTFARSGYYYIPPTKDIGIFEDYVKLLNVKQFSQGSNLYEGLKKFVYYSNSGDVAIVLSDFSFNNLNSEDFEKLTRIVNKKKQKIIFIKLGNTIKDDVCKNLAYIFNTTCFKVTTERDFSRGILSKYVVIPNFDDVSKEINLFDRIKLIILSLFSL